MQVKQRSQEMEAQRKNGAGQGTKLAGRSSRRKLHGQREQCVCPASGRLITLICRLYRRSWKRWRRAAEARKRGEAEGADDGTRG